MTLEIRPNIKWANLPKRGLYALTSVGRKSKDNFVFKMGNFIFPFNYLFTSIISLGFITKNGGQMRSWRTKVPIMKGNWQLLDLEDLRETMK